MDHPFPSPRVYVLLASFGLKGQQGESLSRHPAVSVQFSPLMSWTTTLPVQDSSEGTTSPTPLPLRVGATAMTCSGPAWRRYSLPWRTRNRPVNRNRPARAISQPFAHTELPQGETVRLRLARPTDPAPHTAPP